MGNQLTQIAEGFYNNLTNKKEDLYNTRIEICRRCKLIILDKLWGECCNSNLYLNTETDETSLHIKPGFRNGCGCVLNSKGRVPEAQCPVNKW